MRLPVLTGLSKHDAIKIMAMFKMNYRISREDDKVYTLSTDFDKNRVNLIIKDNIITHYTFH